MKALSIRSPWWWFILHAGKDVENRDWATSYRGLLLIHASKWWRNAEALDDFRAALDCCSPAAQPEVLAQLDVGFVRRQAGCLVGSVEIVDCVSRSESPWFFGRYGFVLQNPIAFARPVPFKGALGLFDVPSSALEGKL